MRRGTRGLRYWAIISVIVYCSVAANLWLMQYVSNYYRLQSCPAPSKTPLPWKTTFKELYRG